MVMVLIDSTTTPLDKYPHGITRCGMNKHNRLLALLDDVFGFADKKESTYRKAGQHYDERTNEHVVLIEYRVRRGTRNDRAVASMKTEHTELLREINARANLCGGEITG
jgi:hypothetical protein